MKKLKLRNKKTGKTITLGKKKPKTYNIRRSA